MSWWKRLFGQRHGDSAGARPGRSEPVEQAEATPLVVFQPYNDLERQLQLAATNPDARPGFERALLDATLYAATPDAPQAEGTRVVGAEEQISLLNVQSPDGQPVAAIFTAQERIAEVFGLGTGYVAMQGETLLAIVSQQGAWLNPGFPYSVHWSGEQLSALLGKPVTQVIETETRLMLGTPSNPPTALLAQIQAALTAEDRIVEAWFALAQWPGEQFAWHLDIRTELPAEAVRDLLAEVFRRGDFEGHTLNMVVNRPDGSNGAGIRLVPAQTH
jgi:type III secretion system (T3SS) SseB-like protein